MRTTLTLDDDLLEKLKQEARKRKQSLKEVINATLYAGLRAPPLPTQKPYRLTPHRSAINPGFDLRSLNRLADTLEDEELIGRALE